MTLCFLLLGKPREVHPPKFSLLSKEALMRNTEAVVPAPTAPLKSAFVRMLDAWKCRWKGQVSGVYTEDQGPVGRVT